MKLQIVNINKFYITFFHNISDFSFYMYITCMYVLFLFLFLVSSCSLISCRLAPSGTHLGVCILPSWSPFLSFLFMLFVHPGTAPA